MKFNSSKYNQHWQDKPLNKLGEFQRGKSRHRPRNDIALFEGGKHPLIQTGEVKDANLYITKHSATYNDFGLAQSKLWPKDTLCITIAANIAETALLSYPMCFPDSVVGFNAYPEESSELFMHYVFTYIREAIQNSASGSIQDNINLDYLTRLNFKIPLKDYQDQIAAVLSALDAKIDCNNRINAELEAMAKTLYDYWFVQFDFPISKAQAQAMGSPALEGKPYKSSGGKMEYNKVLKREIPVGWKDSSILAVADLLGGGTPTKKNSEFWGGEIPFFTPTDADGTVFKFTTADYITSEGLKKSSTKLFPKNTIFITARGSVGRLVLTGVSMAMNQSCYALQANPKIPHTFLFFLTKELVHHLEVKSSGSVFDSIVSNDIEFTKLAIPDLGIVQQFGEIVDPAFKQIANNIQQNHHLAQLRDWLLPMLMNGQVTVA